MESKFYQFTQNNSGGHFVLEKDSGLTCYVVIEAFSAKEANSILERIGGYFNGVDEGIDCPCCGDRWHMVYEDEAEDSPCVYGQPVGVKQESNFIWRRNGQEVSVVRLDGTVEWYNSDLTPCK